MGLFNIIFQLSSLIVICKLARIQKGSEENYKQRWRIAGGWPVTDITQHPYMVSIQKCSGTRIFGYCSNFRQRHWCGGGLLNHHYVITACHCVADIIANGSGPAIPFKRGAKSLTFVAGTTNLIEKGPHTQVRVANKIHHHPKCATIDHGVIIYDLGLAVMKTPFKLSIYVRPLNFFKSYIDLERKLKEITSYQPFPLNPNSSTPSPKDMPQCVVAGWGDIRHGYNEHNILSETLNAVFMYVIPEPRCLRAFRERDKFYEGFSFRLHHQICAVSKFGNESDCGGDSGSPVICGGFLIALVSYGYDCGSSVPSVYQAYTPLSSWFSTNITSKGDRQKSIINAAGDAEIVIGFSILHFSLCKFRWLWN